MIQPDKILHLKAGKYIGAGGYILSAFFVECYYALAIGMGLVILAAVGRECQNWFFPSKGKEPRFDGKDIKYTVKGGLYWTLPIFAVHLIIILIFRL